MAVVTSLFVERVERVELRQNSLSCSLKNIELSFSGDLRDIKDTIFYQLDSENSEKGEVRAEWYSLLAGDTFRPCISTAGMSLFVDAASECFKSEISSLDLLIRSTLDRYAGDVCCAEIERLEKSLFDLLKYLPDLVDYNPSFFVDGVTGNLGFTVKRSGTITIMVEPDSKLSYSYAIKGDSGGLVRFTGTAKMSKFLGNSRHISKLLRLTREF